MTRLDLSFLSAQIKTILQLLFLHVSLFLAKTLTPSPSEIHLYPRSAEIQAFYVKMWKILYFVTVIGVFLQATNGQDWDIEKMEQCPCANDVVESFLDSVAKNTVDVDNGQKLRLRLWQLNNDDCAAHVQDESPKPGRIEISMVYSGTVHIEEQGEGEDQYKSEDDEEQQGRIDGVGQDMSEDIGILYRSIAPVYQQGRVDFGQQQGGGDIGQQQEDENIGQQQEGVDIGQQQEYGNIGQQQEGVDIGQQQEDGDIVPQQRVDIGQQQEDGDIVPQQRIDIGQQQVAEDIEQMLGSIDLEQLQQLLDLGQEQAGVDTAQEQPQLSNGGKKKDYSAQFSFTVDVNTGKLSESTDSVKGINRRKRDIMPFETVVIKIALNLDQKQDSDAATRNDQIKSLLRKGLEDYWLAMAFCLLDVKQ